MGCGGEDGVDGQDPVMAGDSAGGEAAGSNAFLAARHDLTVSLMAEGGFRQAYAYELMEDRWRATAGPRMAANRVSRSVR